MSMDSIFIHNSFGFGGGDMIFKSRNYITSKSDEGFCRASSGYKSRRVSDAAIF